MDGHWPTQVILSPVLVQIIEPQRMAGDEKEVMVFPATAALRKDALL